MDTSKISGIKESVEQYNDWTGAAIITLSGNEVQCTVGQAENYVDGYTVLASKLMSDNHEFDITPEEIYEIIEAM